MSTGTDAKPSRRGVLLLIAIVCAGGLLWTGVLLTGPSEAGDEPGTPLFSDTESFLRQPITLTGRVTQRYDGGVFALAVGGGLEALVIPADGGDAEAPSGAVRVSGNVRRVGVDLRPLVGGDIAVRRGDPALEDAEVVDVPGY